MDYSTELGLNHPDGCSAQRKANAMHDIATERYVKALKALTDFVLGKQLPWNQRTVEHYLHARRSAIMDQFSPPSGQRSPLRVEDGGIAMPKKTPKAKLFPIPDSHRPCERAWAWAPLRDGGQNQQVSGFIPLFFKLFKVVDAKPQPPMQRLPGMDEFLLVIKSLPALESSQELLSDLFEVLDDISYVFAGHQIALPVNPQQLCSARCALKSAMSCSQCSCMVWASIFSPANSALRPLLATSINLQAASA